MVAHDYEQRNSSRGAYARLLSSNEENQGLMSACASNWLRGLSESQWRDGVLSWRGDEELLSFFYDHVLLSKFAENCIDVAPVDLDTVGRQ